MNNQSWWLGLTREAFGAAVPREAQRMASDPKAKIYFVSFYETKVPRRQPTIKTYADEQRERESFL